MAGSLVVDTGRKESYWVSYVKNRLNKKKNFLGIFTGSTGSGKSYSQLSYCEQIDSNFHPDRIIFSLKEMMKLINEDKVKTKQAIMWDEGGIEISNRNWQGIVNKSVNALLQTFRHKQIVLLMSVPYLDFIDSNTRKLFHAEFLTQSIDYKENRCKVKPQLIQYNPRNKKYYYKYLRVVTKQRGVCPVKSWSVKKPSAWLIEAYEQKKILFTKNLNIRIEKEIQTQEKTFEGVSLTQKQEEVMNLMKKYNNADVVAKKIGITRRVVYFHMAQSKKKGYTLENLGKTME